MDSKQNSGNLASQRPDADSEHVFEFTPDLNIAPIKSADAAPPPAPIPPEARPKTALQEAIGRINMPQKLREQLVGKPGEPVQATPPKPRPAAPIGNQIQTETPRRKINLLEEDTPPAQSLRNNPAGMPSNNSQETPFSNVSTPLSPENAATSFQGGESMDHRDFQSRTNIQYPTELEKAKEKVDETPLLAEHSEDVSSGSNENDGSASFVPPPSPKPLTMDASGNAVETPSMIEKDPQKALRTYESDVAEALARKNMSTAGIVIAEQKRDEKREREEQAELEKTIKQAEQQRQELPPEPEPLPMVHTMSAPPQEQAAAQEISSQTEPKKKTGIKISILLISLIFILGGAIGGYVLYSNSPLAPSTPAPAAPEGLQSLISSDSHVSMSIDGLSANQIASRIQTELQKPQAAGTLKEIVLTRSGQGIIPGPDMVSLLDIPAPSMLIRSLTSSWMLGIFADSSGNKDVFIVATHNFFQNAFAGMLSWEDKMPDDIKQYLYAGNSSPYLTVRGHFVDGIVKNRDVREFRSEDGSTLFVYSFIDNNKLVIASKESTLAEVITRLERQTFLR